MTFYSFHSFPLFYPYSTRPCSVVGRLLERGKTLPHITSNYHTPTFHSMLNVRLCVLAFPPEKSIPFALVYADSFKSLIQIESNLAYFECFVLEKVSFRCAFRFVSNLLVLSNKHSRWEIIVEARRNLSSYKSEFTCKAHKILK